MSEKKIVFIIYFLTIIGILIWISAILLAPYLASQSHPINRLIYEVFSPTCHQIPSRCYSLFGYPMAVCSRCLGIYIGFLAGAIFFPLINGFKPSRVPAPWLFLLMTFPIAADTAGNFLSLWSTPDWLRLFFGFFWGLILPFYFMNGLADFFIHLQKKKKRV